LGAERIFVDHAAVATENEVVISQKPDTYLGTFEPNRTPINNGRAIVVFWLRDRPTVPKRVLLA
jgi:hypothetical protein